MSGRYQKEIQQLNDVDRLLAADLWEVFRPGCTEHAEVERASILLHQAIKILRDVQ